MSQLSRDLFDIPMIHKCPHCNHPLVKKGSWFYSIRHYKCEACNQKVQVTYDDKVKLFKTYTPKSN